MWVEIQNPENLDKVLCWHYQMIKNPQSMIWYLRIRKTHYSIAPAGECSFFIYILEKRKENETLKLNKSKRSFQVTFWYKERNYFPVFSFKVCQSFSLTLSKYMYDQSLMGVTNEWLIPAKVHQRLMENRMGFYWVKVGQSILTVDTVKVRQKTLSWKTLIVATACP